MRSKRMLFAFALSLGLSGAAYAGPVSFNFNTLSAGANSSAIQGYMQGILNSTYGNGVVTVTVTGAIADSGAVQSSNLHWNADGHTVGANSGTSTSITLGNSENCTIDGPVCTAGANDSYIRNDSLGLAGTASDVITMTFTGITFNQAGFNWEIFPDASCTAADGTHCGGTGNPNLPDFAFVAGANTPFTANGVVPGTGGTYSNSPLGAETAPQAMGTGSWSFASTNTFQFVDWPATIGIDNLTFTPPSSVPEPASVALLLTIVMGCYFLRRKQRKA